MRPIDIEGNPDKGVALTLCRGLPELQFVCRRVSPGRRPSIAGPPKLSRLGQTRGRATSANRKRDGRAATAPPAPPPTRPDHNALRLFDGARSSRWRGGKARERGRARCRCNQEACAAGDGDPTQHGSEEAPAVEFGHGFTLLDFGLEFDFEFGARRACAGAGRAQATPVGCAQVIASCTCMRTLNVAGCRPPALAWRRGRDDGLAGCAAKAHPYERRTLPSTFEPAGAQDARARHGGAPWGAAPVRGVKAIGCNAGGPCSVVPGGAWRGAAGTPANTAQKRCAGKASWL